MNSRKKLFVSAIAALGLFLAACGGGGGNNPPATISVVISNAPASMVIGTTATITAAVSNDTSSAGVTWTVTCGSATCGSVNPSTATGNSPSTVFTAPAAVPTGNTVTITATSVANTAATSTATITITETSAAVLADGNYVFNVAGEDPNGTYFVAGVFTVASGAITGGEQDYVDQASGSNNTINAATSSLTAASDGNFQLVLDTGNANIGVNGVETFRGTLVSGSRAQITEFDAFAAGNGTLDLQTSKAAPSGGYAFNLGGVDGTTNQNALFIGGVITISGATVNVSNSVFDYFDGGTIGQAQNFASGTVGAPDSFGRITLNLTTGSSSSSVQFGMSGYIIGTNKIQLIEDLDDQLQGTLGGAALGQGGNAGGFTTANVGGNTYVFGAVGVDAANGTAIFAGGFMLNSNGTVTGDLAYNDTANDQGFSITGGTWTVSSLGRVALSNVTVAGSDIGNGPFAFQLYLDGNGNALEVGTDSIQGTSGLSYLQTTGQVNAGKYALGAGGFAFANNLPVWSAAGPVTLDSSLNWTGFTDYNVFTGTPEANVALTGTTDTSKGLFSINGLNAATPIPGTPEFGYFPIDNSRVLAIEVDDNQLGLLMIEQVSTQ